MEEINRSLKNKDSMPGEGQSRAPRGEEQKAGEDFALQVIQTELIANPTTSKMQGPYDTHGGPLFGNINSGGLECVVQGPIAGRGPLLGPPNFTPRHR